MKSGGMSLEKRERKKDKRQREKGERNRTPQREAVH